MLDFRVRSPWRRLPLVSAYLPLVRSPLFIQGGLFCSVNWRVLTPSLKQFVETLQVSVIAFTGQPGSVQSRCTCPIHIRLQTVSHHQHLYR